MARLPQPGGDSGNWGDILNDYLSQVHKADGTLKDDSVGSAQLAPGAVAKADVGLGNVDNTADSAKPVSVAQQAVFDLKADASALAAKLNTADLDTQAAAKITTGGTATQVALNAAFTPSLVPTYAAPRTRLWLPKGSAYNLKGSNTRRLRAALGAALANTGLCKIAVAGASNTAGAGVGTGNIGKLDPATQLRKLLAAAGYPIAGTGWVYANNKMPAAGFAGIDYRLTVGASWTPALADATTPYLYASTSGRTLSMASDLPGTIAEILTYGNGTTPFAVTVDGAAQTNVAFTGSNAPQIMQYSGQTDATHTLALTTGAASAVVAMRVRRATGVDVTNAGISGSTAGNWLNTGVNSWYAPLSVLKAQTPDVVFIDLYGNEALQDVAAATFQTNLLGMVQQLQAIGTDVILLIAPEPNPAGSPGGFPTGGLTQVKVEAKLAAMYNVADTADVPLIDANDALGLYTQANNNGLMYDAVHLSGAGTSAIAHVLKQALTL